MPHVYALIDPQTDETRYIGVTVNFKDRLRSHRYGQNGKRVSDWIERLRQDQQQPRINILEEVSCEDMFSRERWWITSYLARGTPLLNYAGNPNRHRLEPTAKLRLIFTLLQSATSPQDMNFPGSRLQELGGHQQGVWSVDVADNWRVTFRFDGQAATDVTYEEATCVDA